MVYLFLNCIFLNIKLVLFRQKVLATFKGFILNDELYSTFDNFLEEIIIVFSNYFKNDNDAFLNCIFDLINLLNHPDLNVDSQQLTTGIEMCSEVSASCTQNERMNSVINCLFWFFILTSPLLGPCGS